MEYQEVHMTYGSRKFPAMLRLYEDQVTVFDEGWSEEAFILDRADFNTVFDVAPYFLVANLDGKKRNYRIDKEGYEVLKGFMPPFTFENMRSALWQVTKSNVVMGIVCIVLSYYVAGSVGPRFYGFDVLSLVPAVLLLVGGVLAYFRPAPFCFVWNAFFWVSLGLFNGVRIYLESENKAGAYLMAAAPLFIGYLALLHYWKYRKVKRPVDEF
ncbi:MAG: hypothetical protein JW936_03080 [Sedimentisphaerales bacterium]|nr:hypothetical protein [Sedimentisphaerales bacterium]